MPVKRLNDREIAAIVAPAPDRKQDIYYDDKLKGFGLRVTPFCKTFIVESRVKGRTCRVSLGKWGPVTAADARDKAKKFLGQMIDGIDPNQVKAAEKVQGITLAEVFEEYKKRKTTLRDKTLSVYNGAFDRCLANWADKPISDISRDMVEQKYTQLCEAEWKRGTTGEAQASQGMRLLSALFNFAMNVYDGPDGKPLITYNSVKRLSHVQRGWSRGKRRQGVITDNELPAFYQGVMQLKHQTARDYLLFLVLTGLRKNEAARLHWKNEVDMINKFIILPPERTKNKLRHTLPLTDFLYDMLKKRQPVDIESSPYVFPGHGKNRSGYYAESKAAYTSVGDHMEKKFAPHDLRRTFITIAERLKIEHYALKQLLNHSNSNDVTGGYIVIDPERLREPMQQITDYILEQVGVKEPRQDIIDALDFNKVDF